MSSTLMMAIGYIISLILFAFVFYGRPSEGSDPIASAVTFGAILIGACILFGLCLVAEAVED